MRKHTVKRKVTRRAKTRRGGAVGNNNNNDPSYNASSRMYGGPSSIVNENPPNVSSRMYGGPAPIVNAVPNQYAEVPIIPNANQYVEPPSVPSANPAPNQNVNNSGVVKQLPLPPQFQKAIEWVNFTLQDAQQHGWEEFSIIKSGEVIDMPASMLKNGKHVYPDGKEINKAQAMSLAKQRWSTRMKDGTRKDLYNEFSAAFDARMPKQNMGIHKNSNSKDEEIKKLKGQLTALYDKAVKVEYELKINYNELFKKYKERGLLKNKIVLDYKEVVKKHNELVIKYNVLYRKYNELVETYDTFVNECECQ